MGEVTKSQRIINVIVVKKKNPARIMPKLVPLASGAAYPYGLYSICNI
jgi:hypothetical protein